METTADLLREIDGKPNYRPAPRGYQSASWSGLSPELLVHVVDVIRAKHWPLYIAGGAGVGKTCVAALLYQRCRRQPMWLRADDLLLALATGRSSKELMHVDSINEDGKLVRKLVTFGQYQRRLAEVPWLFLDDLGIRSPTDAMRQYMFDLLEYRKGLPLVITSNLSPEGLAEMYDDRIISRLTAGTVLEIDGEDRRAGTGKRLLVGGV